VPTRWLTAPAAVDLEAALRSPTRGQPGIVELHNHERIGIVIRPQWIFDAHTQGPRSAVHEVTTGVHHDAFDRVVGRGEGGGPVHDPALGKRVQVEGGHIADPQDSTSVDGEDRFPNHFRQLGQLLFGWQLLLLFGLPPATTQQTAVRVERPVAHSLPPNGQCQDRAQFLAPLCVANSGVVAIAQRNHLAGGAIHAEDVLQAVDLAEHGVFGPECGALCSGTDLYLNNCSQHRLAHRNMIE
jgi:hypothetical protein